jgi:hypothetical protein
MYLSNQVKSITVQRVQKGWKRLVWILILKYRMGKIYHGVKKSMVVGIGCAAQSVVAPPPLLTILGWWGVYQIDD